MCIKECFSINIIKSSRAIKGCQCCIQSAYFWLAGQGKYIVHKFSSTPVVRCKALVTKTVNWPVFSKKSMNCIIMRDGICHEHYPHW